jgi:hypothetical protein
LIYIGSETVVQTDLVLRIESHLKDEYGLDSFDIFCEDLQSSISPVRRIEKSRSWTLNGCQNGSILILQCHAPLKPEVCDAFSTPSEEISDEGSDIRRDLPVVVYYSIMIRELPPTFEEYYSLRRCTNDLRLLSWTCEETKILRVPLKITLEKFKEFVIKVEECKPELVLFRNKPKSCDPNPTPITIFPKDDPHFTHVYYVEGAGGPRKNAIIVDFSRDGYRRTARRLFYVEFPGEFAQIKKGMETFVTGNCYRILHIRENVIHAVIPNNKDSFSGIFRGATDQIRFEIVPQDQRDVEVDELVKVTQVTVSSNKRPIRKEFPFFLRVKSDATLEIVKEQIKGATQKSDEVMTHYRFMVRRCEALETSFELQEVLKKEAKIVVGQGCTLVMIAPADELAISGSRHEAVKIQG